MSCFVWPFFAALKGCRYISGCEKGAMRAKDGLKQLREEDEKILIIYGSSFLSDRNRGVCPVAW